MQNDPTTTADDKQADDAPGQQVDAQQSGGDLFGTDTNTNTPSDAPPAEGDDANAGYDSEGAGEGGKEPAITAETSTVKQVQEEYLGSEFYIAVKKELSKVEGFDVSNVLAVREFSALCEGLVQHADADDLVRESIEGVLMGDAGQRFEDEGLPIDKLVEVCRQVVPNLPTPA